MKFVNRHTLGCAARAAVVYVLAFSAGLAIAQDSPPSSAPPSDLIPHGLDGITFPGALVVAAYLVRGWTPEVRIVVEHQADEKLRRALRQASTQPADGDGR